MERALPVGTGIEDVEYLKKHERCERHRLAVAQITRALHQASRQRGMRNGKPNPVHLFDVGSAWQNAALQATALGIVAHGMAGFDFAKARTVLHVPEVFGVAAMFALGRPGNPDELPPDYRALEIPSQRRPIRESICEGAFNFVDENPS